MIWSTRRMPQMSQWKIMVPCRLLTLMTIHAPRADSLPCLEDRHNITNRPQAITPPAIAGVTRSGSGNGNPINPATYQMPIPASAVHLLVPCRFQSSENRSRSVTKRCSDPTIWTECLNSRQIVTLRHCRHRQDDRGTNFPPRWRDTPTTDRTVDARNHELRCRVSSRRRGRWNWGLTHGTRSWPRRKS